MEEQVVANTVNVRPMAKAWLAYVMDEGGRFNLLGYYSEAEADEALEFYKKTGKLENPSHHYQPGAEIYLEPESIMRLEATEMWYYNLPK